MDFTDRFYTLIINTLCNENSSSEKTVASILDGRTEREKKIEKRGKKKKLAIA